jgi:hypothetical protein
VQCVHDVLSIRILVHAFRGDLQVEKQIAGILSRLILPSAEPRAVWLKTVTISWTLSTSEHLPRCSRLARQPCLVLINRYAHRHHRIACTISWLTCKPCAMREDLARPVKRTTRAGVWKDATTADNRRLRSGGKSEALLSGGVRRRLANQEMSQKADIH